MLSRITVPLGVIVGVLCALLFSSVVAFGPAPGKAVLPHGKNQPAQDDQSDAERNSRPSTERKQAGTKEAECRDSNQNYEDCLIQLRTARATERQAETADKAFWVACVALALAAIAAAAAIRTVRTMRATSQMENRAWLKIEDPEVAQPLQIHTGGVQFSARVTIRNVGRTPAKNVFIQRKLVLVGGPRQTLDAEIRALRSVGCARYLTNGRAAIFPDDCLPTGAHVIWAAKKEVEAVISVLPPNHSVVPLLVLAVTYGVVGDTKPRETGRIYWVGNVELRGEDGDKGMPILDRTSVSEEWTT